MDLERNIAFRTYRAFANHNSTAKLVQITTIITISVKIRLIQFSFIGFEYLPNSVKTEGCQVDNKV